MKMTKGDMVIIGLGTMCWAFLFYFAANHLGGFQ
jgi:hypothetical protein